VLALTALVAGCVTGPKAELLMPESSDVDAIHREIEAFSRAWNKGDAKAAASFYTEDGVRVGALGDVEHGRVEIEAGYERLLHGPFSGATVSQEHGTVRILSPDLAVWQGGMQITPASGRAPLKGHVVQLMKKVGDRWLVLEAHPKLFPPPPSTAAALARRYWEDVINQGKAGALDEIFAPDYIQHHVGVPPGLAGIKQFVKTMSTAFPDQHATVEQILVEGDRVMTRTIIRATHTGPFRDLPPTGRSITVEVLDVWRVEDGKLKEHWGVFDNLAFQRQLGLIPEQKPPATPQP
jgi:uncharacterized protein (TIGR02246 family)/steroid delta-isomerase-like uncharacterized protein